MNQGKLEVVKKEMARVNVNILRISKLKWTGMGEFNSDTHFICYCGQESLKRWSSHHSQQKSLKCSTWMQSRNNTINSIHFQGKPLSITVIQVYALTSNAEEADVEEFYEDLQDLLERKPKKDVLFIIRD